MSCNQRITGLILTAIKPVRSRYDVQQRSLAGIELGDVAVM